MTDNEKQAMINEYVNTCARIGETLLAEEIAAATIVELKKTAREMLDRIKKTNDEVKNGTDTKRKARTAKR